MTIADAALPRTRIEPSGTWAIDVRELWAYRELLGFLIWRDVKVRYKQTALGIAWAVLQPLVPMVLFTVIFGRVAKLPSDGVPYPLFTLAGLLPWQLFASALGGASGSVVGSSGLITKVYFPRLITPLAAVCAALVDFVVSLILLILLMTWYGWTPDARVALVPVFVLWAMLAAFGVALWTSSLNVRYRDVQYLMPFVTQVWLLASPVAYSLTLVSSSPWRVVYALNPMVGVVQGFRWALLGSAAPGEAMWPGIIVTLLITAGGLVYFRRTEDSFADLI